jgi:hypothetical protein
MTVLHLGPAVLPAWTWPEEATYNTWHMELRNDKLDLHHGFYLLLAYLSGAYYPTATISEGNEP